MPANGMSIEGFVTAQLEPATFGELVEMVKKLEGYGVAHDAPVIDGFIAIDVKYGPADPIECGDHSWSEAPVYDWLVNAHSHEEEPVKAPMFDWSEVDRRAREW
jgi:hypothetical protein